MEAAVAFANKNSRFSIKVVGGSSYNVLFTSEDTEPLTVSKFVKPGMEGEVKVSLSPMVVATEVASPSIQEAPSTNDSLSAAIKDVKTKKAEGNGQELPDA